MKMKKIVKISIIALLVGCTAFTFSGCGKYEDGPSISLLTKSSSSWHLGSRKVHGEWRGPNGSMETSLQQ